MECGYARLTVWFADPFWVGVYEREAEGRLEVCRHTFGAEPKDGEVWQWLLSAWRGLDFSPAVEAPRRPSGRENPKRVRGHYPPPLPISSARINRAPAHILFPR